MRQQTMCGEPRGREFDPRVVLLLATPAVREAGRPALMALPWERDNLHPPNRSTGTTMRALVWAATLVCLSATASAEQLKSDYHSSANFYVPGCRAALGDIEDKTPLVTGLCIGATEAVGVFAKLLATNNSCIPSHVPVGAIIRTTLLYLESRPQRWHEPYVSLAMEAVAKNWPCKRPQR